MTEHALDIIRPDIILQHVGGYQMAFAEAVKGTGNRDDGNFFDLVTPWYFDPLPVVRELYMRTLMFNVRSAIRQGFNFMEFWGWPEIRARDDGTMMVYSRLRFMRAYLAPPTPRTIN